VSPVPNGVRASSLDARWIKSRHSNAEGNCVEFAALADGAVAIRNSRDPDGPALVCTPAEVTAFLAGAKDGEFDHLVQSHRAPGCGTQRPISAGDMGLGVPPALG
jgi:hypothetical protein